MERRLAQPCGTETLSPRPVHAAVHSLHEVAMRRWFVAVVLLAGTLPAFARTSDDRVAFGRDITVASGATAADIVCAFCRVRLHGSVRGDVAVLFGNVTVDAGQSVSGDVAMLGADLNLGEGSSVGGDVAMVAGDANLAPGSTIQGDRVVLPGRAWLLVLLSPLLILAGLVWLIVWIVRRNSYPPAAYPPSR